MKNNPKDRGNATIQLHGVSNRFAVLAGVLLLLVLSSAASLASIVFSEDMGTTAPTVTPFPPVTTFTGFHNYGTLSFSGSGDVRSTAPSVSYTGASGGDNVFLTDGGTSASFIISSINTVGYSSLSLTFGAFKSTTASSMSELALSYSINGGSSYTPLPFPAQPTGSGTTGWRLITGISLPTDAEGLLDLRLRWINTDPAGGPAPQFRLDDVTLMGAAVPEPSTFIAGALLALPFGVQGVRYLRNRKRA